MSLEYHKEEFGHWTSDEDDDYDEDEEIGKYYETFCNSEFKKYILTSHRIIFTFKNDLGSNSFNRN